MKNLQSEEDYLERILMLQEKGHVRSIDLATDMNFSKPSISVAMKKLKEKELITIDENGFIFFTDEGLKRASAVYDRHKVISTLLMEIGVSKEQALEDACNVEHCISEETFEKLKEVLKEKKSK